MKATNVAVRTTWRVLQYKMLQKECHNDSDHTGEFPTGWETLKDLGLRKHVENETSNLLVDEAGFERGA